MIIDGPVVAERPDGDGMTGHAVSSLRRSRVLTLSVGCASHISLTAQIKVLCSTVASLGGSVRDQGLGPMCGRRRLVFHSSESQVNTDPATILTWPG